MQTLIKDSQKIILNSANENQVLNYINGEYKSHIQFKINPLNQNHEVIYRSCAVAHAEISISYYNINENNNILEIDNIIYEITKGNYDANSLITELVRLTNLTIVLSHQTGKLTISSDTNFNISYNNTCGNILGFKNGLTYSSSNNILELPYMVNCLGTKTIKIIADEIQTLNHDENNKNYLINIQQTQAPYGLLLYNNTNKNYSIMHDFHSNYLTMSLVDDYDRYINFNNANFTITIEILSFYYLLSFKTPVYISNNNIDNNTNNNNINNDNKKEKKPNK